MFTSKRLRETINTLKSLSKTLSLAINKLESILKHLDKS